MAPSAWRCAGPTLLRRAVPRSSIALRRPRCRSRSRLRFPWRRRRRPRARLADDDEAPSTLMLPSTRLAAHLMRRSLDQAQPTIRLQQYVPFCLNNANGVMGRRKGRSARKPGISRKCGFRRSADTVLLIQSQHRDPELRAYTEPPQRPQFGEIARIRFSAVEAEVISA